MNPNMGVRVLYKDYLGFVRKGRVKYILDPTSNHPEDVRYCCVVDEEDPAYNIHDITMANGQVLMYAELRLSTDLEVIPEVGEE